LSIPALLVLLAAAHLAARAAVARTPARDVRSNFQQVLLWAAVLEEEEEEEYYLD
jgi:hypothetical protein